MTPQMCQYAIASGLALVLDMLGSRCFGFCGLWPTHCPLPRFHRNILPCRCSLWSLVPMDDAMQPSQRGIQHSLGACVSLGSFVAAGGGRPGHLRSHRNFSAMSPFGVIARSEPRWPLHHLVTIALSRVSLASVSAALVLTLTSAASTSFFFASDGSHACTHARTHACTRARAGMRCVPRTRGRARAGVEQRQRGVACQNLACKRLPFF
jgi:hypothetical protein